MTPPNILMIVSDEERRNDWLQGKVSLPAHDRLVRDGLSFNRYYTHSSPCSPSRASLYTGRYLADHGVVDNVSFPTHTALSPDISTIGSLVTEAGYRSSYLGKWHLSHTTTPNLSEHGYEDWEGDDRNFVGGPCSGRRFDPVIANYATDWLKKHGNGDTPWFLTVALVNPHDIMWYPIDHVSYQEKNPEDAKLIQAMMDIMRKGKEHIELEPPPENYPQLFDKLPENFEDDLHTKPEVQRAWRTVRNTEHFVGSMSLEDHQSWLRQLDYYAWLHELLDNSLSDILRCLDELGIYDDTTIIYTSDHGDACGSHGGLRAKLPCVYEEVMGVPLIIKPARGSAEVGEDGSGGGNGGNTSQKNQYSSAGQTTDALATHVDLAATVCSMAGLNLTDHPTLCGNDLTPVVSDPAASVRDYVFFSQDSAQSDLICNSRYAVRGFFDGQTKYARYYGIGGGIRRDGARDESGKLIDADASFEDHDHEWYDHTEDPQELHNLAHHRTHRTQLRKLFTKLLEIEASELQTPTPKYDGTLINQPKGI